jgi:heme-degrading monooxygenase HmoA
MMAILLMQVHVKNYGVWRKVFDDAASQRKSIGGISAEVFRGASDPNALTVVSKWDSMANAQKFAASADLKEAQLKAGVEGIPTASFLTEA